MNKTALPNLLQSIVRIGMRGNSVIYKRHAATLLRFSKQHFPIGRGKNFKQKSIQRMRLYLENHPTDVIRRSLWVDHRKHYASYGNGFYTTPIKK